MRNNYLNQAFTLIEILITLSIIALLVTISTFALSQARTSARDNKRKTDLEFVRSGLELYRADCGGYPASLAWGASLAGSGASPSCPASNVYIQALPKDPQSGTRDYCYNRLSARNYTLCASLENPPSPLPSVANCLNNCGSGCNYVVQSP